MDDLHKLTTGFAGLIALLALAALVALAPQPAEASATINCGGLNNNPATCPPERNPCFNCTACCGSTNCSCTQSDPCDWMQFNGWNQPLRYRTGLLICGDSGPFEFTVFVSQGINQASFKLRRSECKSMHIDELTWSPSQPDTTALVNFTISAPQPTIFDPIPKFTALISRTSNQSAHYTIHKPTIHPRCE